jgi:hypothetical protein
VVVSTTPGRTGPETHKLSWTGNERLLSNPRSLAFAINGDDNDETRVREGATGRAEAMIRTCMQQGHVRMCCRWLVMHA